MFRQKHLVLEENPVPNYFTYQKFREQQFNQNRSYRSIWNRTFRDLVFRCNFVCINEWRNSVCLRGAKWLRAFSERLVRRCQVVLVPNLASRWWLPTEARNGMTTFCQELRHSTKSCFWCVNSTEQPHGEIAKINCCWYISDTLPRCSRRSTILSPCYFSSLSMQVFAFALLPAVVNIE